MKSFKLRTIFCISIILFLFCFISQSEASELSSQYQKKYKINISLYPGQKFKLKKTSKGKFVVKKHTFTQKGIASYKDKKITGIKKGKTKLTLKYTNGSTYIVKIKIKEGIESIDIPQNQISLNTKDSRAIYTNISRDHSAEPIIWKSSNEQVATVNDSGIVTGKKDGTAYITCKSMYSDVSDKIKVSVKDTKYIAFTFDDGPSIYTEALLDSLEEHDSKATFFVLGNRVKKYSDILKRASEYGHQIGNHSYDHPVLSKLKKSEITQQIEETTKLITSTINDEVTVLRPPYGAYNNTVKEVADASLILWSVDTLDWKYRDTSYVEKTILSTADDGDIVLLHDIHKTSVDGFIKAIDTLKKKGYELVTVKELFEINGQKLNKGSIYYYCK